MSSAASPHAGDHSFSPSISKHAASITRNGDVFESLYNDALQRREKRKQKLEQGTIADLPSQTRVRPHII